MQSAVVNQLPQSNPHHAECIQINKKNLGALPATQFPALCLQQQNVMLTSYYRSFSSSPSLDLGMVVKLVSSVSDE